MADTDPIVIVVAEASIGKRAPVERRYLAHKADRLADGSLCILRDGPMMREN